MTDEDDDGHVCMVETVISPRRWHWAYLPAMLFNCFGNFSRAMVQLNDELSMSFHAHALWKQSRVVNKDIVNQFREQIDAL